MYDKNSQRNYSPIGNFMPSYSSYDGIGGYAAGGLSNLVEAIIKLMGYMRW